MAIPYYIYRYGFGAGTREDPTKVYIGQSRAAERALSHLWESSNKKLAQEMHDAEKWPSIEFVKLQHSCLGDLQIAESIMIAVEKSKAKIANANDFSHMCFNARSESGSGWFREPATKSPEKSSYPEDILRAKDAEGVMWHLRSFLFCNDQNKSIVKKAAKAALQGEQVGGSLDFLPDPGSSIEIVDNSDIKKRLKKQHVSTAIVVKMSDKTLGDREPIHLESSPKVIGDRCFKYWSIPTSISKELPQGIPEVLIAVIGSPSFRIIVGSWRIRSYNVDTGTFIAEDVKAANFAHLQGCIFSHPDDFPQSSSMLGLY